MFPAKWFQLFHPMGGVAASTPFVVPDSEPPELSVVPESFERAASSSTPESRTPDELPDPLPLEELLDPAPDELPPPDPLLAPFPELLADELPELPLPDKLPELLDDAPELLPPDELLLDELLLDEPPLDALPEPPLDAAPELLLEEELLLPVTPELLLGELLELPELAPELLLAPPPSTALDVEELDEHPPRTLETKNAKATTGERGLTMGQPLYSLGHAPRNQTRTAPQTAHETACSLSWAERRDGNHSSTGKCRRHDEQAHAPEEPSQRSGRGHQKLDAPSARRNNSRERPSSREHPPRKNPRHAGADDGRERARRSPSVKFCSRDEQRANPAEQEHGDPREEQR
ncbi:MAG: hypothetical protein ABTD50_17375 [Polyangiaceae bacterium]